MKAFPSGLKMLPSFMIIGAQKAGTTAMYKYLIGHPQVLAPWFKETDFFNRRRMFSGDKQYHSLADYQKVFPLLLRKHLLEKLHGNSVITGEASQYLSYKEAPARIKLALPHTKFLVLLRDPTMRAFSHFRMRQRYNWERESFTDAFHREKVEVGMLGASSYKFRGLYAKHLEWWFSEFPRKNFLILENKDTLDPRSIAYRRVCEFLRLEYYSPRITNKMNVGGYAPPEERDLQLWKTFYQPYNDQLFRLLGQDFGWNDEHHDNE